MEITEVHFVFKPDGLEVCAIKDGGWWRVKKFPPGWQASSVMQAIECKAENPLTWPKSL